MTKVWNWQFLFPLWALQCTHLHRNWVIGVWQGSSWFLNIYSRGFLMHWQLYLLLQEASIRWLHCIAVNFELVLLSNWRATFVDISKGESILALHRDEELLAIFENFFSEKILTTIYFSVIILLALLHLDNNLKRHFR